MENYLTVKELGEVFKMAPQTIYNKINKKEFRLGIHYVKPSRKKILFKESAMINWLNGGQVNQPIYNDCKNDPQSGCDSQADKTITTGNRQKPHKNLICI